MDERAVHGVPWTLLTYAGNRVITFGATVVLARLLAPSDFGLLALALLAINAFNVLRDLGLGGAFVLKQDLSRRDQGTVLTLMVGSGVIVAVVLAALSGVIADLFAEPRLAAVLVVMASSVLISGVTWFYETLLQRELEFRRRFVALSAQTVTYAAVSIGAAIAGAGVWSLVAGQLAGTLALAVALVALAPYRVRPTFVPEAARLMLRSGSGFLAQSALAVVQQNADYFAVGRVLGAAQVGFYSMAYRLGDIAYQGLAEPVARVTFPAFARMRHQGDDITDAFLSALRMVAFVACPFGALLSACAEPITRVVFGEQWLPMVGPLAVFGIWAAVRAVQATVAWLLNSVGEAGIMAVISALALALMVPGVLIAADLAGITAVAWVMLADMLASLLALAYVAQRRAGIPIRRQVGAIGTIVVACVFAWFAGRQLSHLLGDSTGVLELVVPLAGGLAAYVAAIAVVDRSLLRWAFDRVLRTLGRGPRGEAMPGEAS